MINKNNQITFMSNSDTTNILIFLLQIHRILKVQIAGYKTAT
jgi:hypothetical protein